MCVRVWEGGSRGEGGLVGHVACAVVDTDVFTYFSKSMQLFLFFLLIS